MAKKITLTIVGLLVVFALLAGVKTLQIRTLIAAGANQTVPPEIVTTAEATSQDWDRLVSSVGSFAAVQGVTVSAEVPGKVVGISFESGSNVHAGDLLVQLDISSEEAQLRSAEASVQLAKVNLERSTDLLAKNAVAKSDFDVIDAQYKQAVAQADNIRAIIAKKTIRAPFDGALGIRLVNLGQYLKDGDAVVSLQELEPIYVNFLLPQQRLAQIAVGQPIHVTSDAIPGQTVDGLLTAINPDVDVATRNVRVQATLANPKGVLRPGMFGEVAVVLGEKDPVIAIPATAVMSAPFGDSVFIVEKTADGGQKLRQQFVRQGTRRGDFVAITSGLKGGEQVVSSGVFKLRNGLSVVVDNKLAPNAQLAPKPNDT